MYSSRFCSTTSIPSTTTNRLSAPGPLSVHFELGPNDADYLSGFVPLYEIEGESAFQLTIEECIDRLTGEIGTPVRIRVRHLDGTEENFEIVRDQIVESSSSLVS